MSELAIREELLELDGREADGIKVELLYRRLGDIVLLHVRDEKLGEEIEFSVPPEKALDAFHHPFAYAPDFPEAA